MVTSSFTHILTTLHVGSYKNIATTKIQWSSSSLINFVFLHNFFARDSINWLRSGDLGQTWRYGYFKFNFGVHVWGATDIFILHWSEHSKYTVCVNHTLTSNTDSPITIENWTHVIWCLIGNVPRNMILYIYMKSRHILCVVPFFSYKWHLNSAPTVLWKTESL
jgi:hypothetical protein